MKTKYLLCLLVVALLPARALAAQLTLGSTVSGQLSEPGAIARFTFSGTSGQRLFYDALDTDSVSINVRIVSPAGTTIWERNSRQDFEPFTLLETGTYRLELDGNGAVAGGYTFRLMDVAAQPALPMEAPVTKTLDPGLSAHGYSFSGTIGQRLYFDAQGANSGGFWALYAPNNQSVASGGIGGDLEITLAQTGVYVLILWGSAPSPTPYLFQVGSSTVTTNQLALGTTVAGTIAKPGDQQIYTFAGAPGQRLLYDALDPADSLQINARLISPGGTVVSERNSRQDVEPANLVLTESGPYTLVLDGIGATTGNYRFRLLDTATQPVLPQDTAVTKNLDPGLAVEVYRLEGLAGGHYYFDGMGANSGAQWGLYAPNGQNIGSAGIGGDFEVTLSVDGTYLLVLWGTSATPVPYSFQVVSAAAPATALNLGALVSGTISEAGDQHVYTFAGVAGQRIYYDSLDRDFEQIYCRLVSPSGALVWDFANQSTDIGPLALVETGNYTLLIDGANATTGDFAFRLLDLAAAPALSLSSRTSAQLDPPNATAAYRLDGTAGQKLNFKSISAAANQPTWRMVGPAQQNVSTVAAISSDLGDVVLPATGPYWLLVEGAVDGVAPVSFQFDATDHTEAPVATTGLGEVRNGTLTSGQQDELAFAGPAGLWVYFDSQDRTANNLTAELLDSSNARVFLVSAAADSGPYVLPRSGNYRLVMSGSGGTFRYRLLDLSAGAAPLALNTTLTATLDPYRTDVYQFQGQPGQRLVYDALENDFSNVAVRLLAPDGQIRFLNGNSDSDSNAPFTLSAPGAYYLFFESNLATPATYSARLLDVASAPELTLETQVSQAINPGLGIVLFRLNQQSGQPLFFNGLSVNTGGSWAVFGPVNQNLGGNNLNSYIEPTSLPGGTWVVALSGNSTTPVTATFQVYTPATGNSDEPRITSIAAGGGSPTVVWQSVAGKAYRLQFKGTLSQTAWLDVAGDVTATGSSASKTDTTLGAAPLRFYRVQVLP